MYANLLASGVVKQAKIVDIRREFEPTLQFERTWGDFDRIKTVARSAAPEVAPVDRMQLC